MVMKCNNSTEMKYCRMLMSLVCCYWQQAVWLFTWLKGEWIQQNKRMFMKVLQESDQFKLWLKKIVCLSPDVMIWMVDAVHRTCFQLSFDMNQPVFIFHWHLDRFFVVVFKPFYVDVSGFCFAVNMFCRWWWMTILINC